MQKFAVLTCVAAPLLRANVDTDAIIPSREMKTVSKSGLADGLFAGWRYARIGSREPNADFVLNQPACAGVQVLLEGLDAIDLTLKYGDEIESFHARDRAQRPWIYLQ